MGPVLVSPAGWVQTVVYAAVLGVMPGLTTLPPTTLRTIRQSVQIEVYVIGQQGPVSAWMVSQDVHVNIWHATLIATTMANVLACGDSRRHNIAMGANGSSTIQCGTQIRSMGVFATRRIQPRIIAACASVPLETIH